MILIACIEGIIREGGGGGGKREGDWSNKGEGMPGIKTTLYSFM